MDLTPSRPQPSSGATAPVAGTAAAAGAPDEFIAAYNARDWERMGSLFASGCVYEQVGRPKRKVEGPDSVVEIFKGWAEAAPGARGEVADRVVGETGAAIELILWGSLEPPFGDYTPSGSPPFVRAALVFHLDGDGRIRELRNYYDSLVLYQLLGIQE
jgi:steroid delta-isomerase-like uncharacterized protein